MHSTWLRCLMSRAVQQSRMIHTTSLLTPRVLFFKLFQSPLTRQQAVAQGIDLQCACERTLHTSSKLAKKKSKKENKAKNVRNAMLGDDFEPEVRMTIKAYFRRLLNLDRISRLCGHVFLNIEIEQLFTIFIDENSDQ